MAYIQRSRGYSTRPTLTISDIEVLCKIVKEVSPETVIMVDNCYGEFVEKREVTEESKVKLDKIADIIKEKTKTIELRLLDEKRSLIKENDTIEFEDRTTNEKLKARVIKLHKYNSFEELYKHHDKVSMGYKIDEEADPKDMEQYYPQEEQSKYGVLGIKVKKM